MKNSEIGAHQKNQCQLIVLNIKKKKLFLQQQKQQ